MENDSVEKTRKNNFDFVDNKAKTCYQASEEKIRKRSLEYYRKLSQDEKIKKKNYAKNRNKNMSDADREKRKEYMNM